MTDASLPPMPAERSTNWSRHVWSPNRTASCSASISIAVCFDSAASRAASSASSIAALTFPSAAASQASAIRSCGPNTATCLPLRVRSSATILAPASARPNAQYDWASSRRAGKLHDAADSDVSAATVCSMRETVSANRPRAEFDRSDQNIGHAPRQVLARRGDSDDVGGSLCGDIEVAA